MSTDLPEADQEDAIFDDDGVLYDDQVTPEIGVLGFTLRELLILGVWLLSFIFSFFPVAGGLSLWAIGIEWILPIAVPTVAVFLLVLRRFSPEGIRRVGSLGIDQFASVAFSVSAVVWAGKIWLAVAAVVSIGSWGVPWNSVAMAIASFALVILTVFAPLIPGLKEDFHGRLVTLAHRNANPVRPVIARPRRERPVVAEEAEADITDASAEPETTTALVTPPEGEGLEQHATDEVIRLDLAEQVPLTAHASGGGTGTEHTASTEEYAPAYSRRSRGQEPEIVSDTGSIESLLGTAARIETNDIFASVLATGEATQPGAAQPDSSSHREAAPAAQAPQPFWILAPSERDVHDERGEPIFRIGPDAWALVIEDRGGAYVVRHDDGRIGYLHEVTDITKG